MGGGVGDSGGTTVIEPPIRQDIPLQQGLIGMATNQLNSMVPYIGYGAGYRLTPQTPFGQVYMPGPNQTIFGNPYNQQNSVPFFGQPAAAPTNVGFQQNQGPQTPFWSLPTPYGQISQPFQQYFGSLLPQTGAQGQLNPGNYPYLPGTGPQNGGSGGGNSGQNQGGNQPSQTDPFGNPPPQYNPAIGGIGVADPWAGTGNAQSVSGGTNWAPNGAYNPQGPYSPIATWVDSNGQPVANNQQMLQQLAANRWTYTPGTTNYPVAGAQPQDVPPGGYAQQQSPPQQQTK